MTPPLPVPLPDVETRSGGPPILRVEAAGDPAGWVREHRDALRAFVSERGALFVRGLDLRDAPGVEAVFRRFGGLTVERETFAARRPYAEGVYSSTPWPPNQAMCMHHELSYVLRPPRFLLFACLRAPGDGGATPLADASAVLRALPAPLVARFEREGWILTRNYHRDIGASLAESFGTDDRGAVDGFCRAHAIEAEWRPGGVLRTRQRRGAVAGRGADGRRCWFNQVAFLSRWTMAPELREYLESEYGEDGLPFDTSLGNGEPVGEEDVRAIHAAYEANTVREPWRAGDLLIVDNLGTAHGRDPFAGPREVLVAMADPMRGGA